ncbi:hypothetical protein M8C21_021409, partial [Ambrosia artemisiifolia]
SSDTIAVHQNFSDGQTIVSANTRFELGFFSPGNSKNRYLGIWFKNTSPQTFVWVANRETPLIDTLGTVKLDNQGNLTLVNGSGEIIWSQLLDTGNLVIRNGNKTNNEIVIWQSLDYPGDTYLPGMKMGKNFITGRETYPTSWRSADDPSPVSPGGKLENFQLNLPNPEWLQSNSLPVDYCDNYEVCGPYGSCNTATYPYCGCLKGFERKTSDDTSPDNDTSVCKRSIALNCGPGEGFKNCEIACKNNCSCTAYANPNITPGGVGCLLWFGDLIDVRVYPQNGQALYVRLAASELSVVLTLLGRILALYIRGKRKKRSNAEREGKATNDFSVENKLGEGGFGPVYKGVLEEGLEIAVKRLSKFSRQGLDEFENEVMCIAKLQHRSLVRLLGYCTHGDDMNICLTKVSTVFYLVHESRKLLLDWPQRFQIFQGIARGLLYLHQDSRLKVVHRDLKARNILLDHQMHPKISDFVLAKMFKEDESEANTKRVVGTLGYISPEYAVNGLFSVKSDIFSFGVLVLEIVSGKKNTGFIHEDHDDNLLAYAWRLHKEGKSLDLIDECLLHVGLLCVQQRVEDRPNTRTVVRMLDGEGFEKTKGEKHTYCYDINRGRCKCILTMDDEVLEITDDATTSDKERGFKFTLFVTIYKSRKLSARRSMKCLDEEFGLWKKEKKPFDWTDMGWNWLKAAETGNMAMQFVLSECMSNEIELDQEIQLSLKFWIDTGWVCNKECKDDNITEYDAEIVLKKLPPERQSMLSCWAKKLSRKYMCNLLKTEIRGMENMMKL